MRRISGSTGLELSSLQEGSSSSSSFSVKERLLHSSGAHHVRFHVFLRSLSSMTFYSVDIIALLIIGVILLIIFMFWQRYLESVQDDPDSPYSWSTPPPLMKLSLWTRANGRFAAMMAIAFTNWCAFMAWTYWVQVSLSCIVFISICRRLLRFSCITKITWDIRRCRPLCVYCQCLSQE